MVIIQAIMMMNVIVVRIQEKLHLMKIFYQQQQWQLMKMMMNLVWIKKKLFYNEY